MASDEAARCRAGRECRSIASVRGVVSAVSPDGAVVEVGGVGLSVSCSPATLARLQVGQPARLATSLVVREDSLTLYGFADDDERALFELLQTANGVGPKLAQTVLAVLPPRETRRAIATSDIRALTQVPGIGRKGAERIVVELRDRVGVWTPTTPPMNARPASARDPRCAVARSAFRHALAGLGFRQEVADAIAIVAGNRCGSPRPPVRTSPLLLGRAQLSERTVAGDGQGSGFHRLPMPWSPAIGRDYAGRSAEVEERASSRPAPALAPDSPASRRSVSS